ncbi:MAG: signal recognition particle-docking protein FtsY [Candidatus Melainabacteria bacterium HGW-Melainabacteria-1]|nr:MAG: signal recognition particle-docking protein FtsY [Candidatus Melainabacteria bacterium HGW-Melainabacteria-1]
MAQPDPSVQAEADAKSLQSRKKSLWEILNTPVQDLFKEGQLVVEDGDESDVAFLGLGRDKPVLEGGEKQSWLAHFRERLARTRSQFADSITRLAKGRTKVDEDMLEELEEILLQSDVGVKTTDDVLAHLRAEAKKRRFLPEEVLPTLTEYLEQTLQSEPFRLVEGKLNIFLIVGVNGTGKTTTVGKIAAKLKIGGYRVMMAAGDTFRAAAIDQLAIWGKRVGCSVIQHHEGADAAAVVYDAIQSARAKKIDALLIDTAGRLHNKDHLMEELRKVHRILEREKQDAHVECILVLDATTGQNGLRQAEVFSKSVPLDSLILTKLDGTAKGGVIFGIKRELGIPIKLLGVGETLGDLQEFDPKSFVQALFAQDDSIEVSPTAKVS